MKTGLRYDKKFENPFNQNTIRDNELIKNVSYAIVNTLTYVSKLRTINPTRQIQAKTSKNMKRELLIKTKTAVMTHMTPTADTRHTQI